ncbi:alternative ribosome-rescue factor A [Pseudoalteromonas xiamenensis]
MYIVYAFNSKLEKNQLEENMSKKSKMVHDHKRGEIKDNAMKALVTSVLFQSKVEKAKKGKGSYSRATKHKGQVPYLMAA